MAKSSTFISIAVLFDEFLKTDLSTLAMETDSEFGQILAEYFGFRRLDQLVVGSREQVAAANEKFTMRRFAAQKNIAIYDPDLIKIDIPPDKTKIIQVRREQRLNNG